MHLKDVVYYVLAISSFEMQLKFSEFSEFFIILSILPVSIAEMNELSILFYFIIFDCFIQNKIIT